VFLTIATERACGGVLISTTKVLTAAHCVRDLSLNRTYAPGGIVVCVGFDRTKCTQRAYGFRMWIHPSYALSASGQYPVPSNLTDMAVLEIVAPIASGPQAVPIPLASPTCTACEASGAAYLLSGYGRVKESSFDSSLWQDLHWGRQDYIPRSTCQAGAVFVLPTTALCAAALNGSTVASCQGDSGGPLAYYDLSQQKWVLAGIVSTGTNVQSGQIVCQASSASQTYDVYVSVRQNYAWIDAGIKGTLPDAITTGYQDASTTVEWYYWVPPMVGCILVLLFFIYVLWDRRRKALMAAMRAARSSSVNIDPTMTSFPPPPPPGQPAANVRPHASSDEPLFSIPISSLTAQYGSMAPALISP
jgi:hypothetical protein